MADHPPSSKSTSGNAPAALSNIMIVMPIPGYICHSGWRPIVMINVQFSRRPSAASCDAVIPRRAPPYPRHMPLELEGTTLSLQPCQYMPFGHPPLTPAAAAALSDARHPSYCRGNSSQNYAKTMPARLRRNTVASLPPLRPFGEEWQGHREGRAEACAPIITLPNAAYITFH